MEKGIGKLLGIIFGIVTLVLIAVTFVVDLGTVTLKGTYFGYTISVTSNTTYFGVTSSGHFSSWANATKGLTGSNLNKAILFIIFEDFPNTATMPIIAKIRATIIVPIDAYIISIPVLALFKFDPVNPLVALAHELK